MRNDKQDGLIERRKLLFNVLLLAPVFSGAATAQPNYSTAPRYDTIRLNPGFDPDPYIVRVQAGGSIDTCESFRRCAGWVDHRPDVNIVWSGGSDLYLRVRSRIDTTLLVNGPSGEWYSNDDTYGHDPAIRFRNARRGRYNVWIGTFERERLFWTELEISEITAR